jgi:hypothetical protein
MRNTQRAGFLMGGIFLIVVILMPLHAEAALVHNLEYSGTKTSAATSFTSGSFTPPDNSLLVVMLAAYNVTSASISGGGLTWTQQVSLQDNGTDKDFLVVWTAPVTTGSSMTVTVSTLNFDASNGTMQIISYTGYDTTTPIGATASNNSIGTDGPQSLTLSAAPDTASEILGVMAGNSNGSAPGETTVTPGTGWTEIEDLFSNGWEGIQTQVITGTTTQTVSWNDINDAPTTMEGTASAAAFEIRAAGGGGGPTVVTFSTPGYGSWVAPAGVTSADVACWGAGGGGGDGTNTGGGGGGAGAYAASTVSVVPGTQYTINIPAGGAGATAAAGTGASPADTTFATTTVVADSGHGGAGGSANAPAGGAAGTAANSTGSVTFSGGAGGAGNNTSDGGGGGGGAGGPDGAGANGSAASTSIGGAGGNGDNGSGGAGGAGGNGVAGHVGTASTKGGGGGGGGDNGLIGGAGAVYGAGGGGGEANGGNGAAGACTVTYSAAVDTTPSRKMILFSGYSIKFYNGRIILYQQ